MSSYGIVSLMSALILLAALSPAEAGASQQKKATTVKKTVKKKRGYSAHKAYLVPPPPAYTPAILPEAYLNADPFAPASMQVVQAEAAPPVNPYKQYIYCANENDMPHPSTARGGVSNWARIKNNSSSSSSKVSSL